MIEANRLRWEKYHDEMKFQYKAKIDLRAGFYLVHVAPNSQKFLGISFAGKAYVYSRMPISPRNSPAVFSKLLPVLFVQLPSEFKETIFLYQDDIMIGGNSKAEVSNKLQYIHISYFYQ